MAAQKVKISEETQRRIEEGLRTWHEPGSQARQRFEAAKRKLDKAHQHITDAIEASERLTADDFLFRVGPCYEC